MAKARANYFIYIYIYSYNSIITIYFNVLNNTIYTRDNDLSGNNSAAIVLYNSSYLGSMFFRNKTATTKEVRWPLRHGDSSL